jgi:hypothetical protein
MVDFQGKSAPFMLYQFVRIKSIVRKFGGDDVIDSADGGLAMRNPGDVQFILVCVPPRQPACLPAARAAPRRAVATPPWVR